MSKIEVYVPFDGKRDILAAHFEKQVGIRFDGLPVTDFTLPADASEEQVRDIAVNFAYENEIDKLEYIIGETDFFYVFEIDGEPVGWNIDLTLWERNPWELF